MTPKIMEDAGFDEQLKRFTAGVCSWCGEELTDFKDELSIREYKISGFCQACQDATFGDDDDDADHL